MKQEPAGPRVPPPTAIVEHDMNASLPPESNEGLDRSGGALGSVPVVGTKLPFIAVTEDPAGWLGSWLLWSRAAVSLGVSLAGHVGVLAWLGYASSVFFPQRIPVQQGRASIHLQAAFASAASQQHFEPELELVESKDRQPTWTRHSPRPIVPATAAATPVSVQRIDIKLPLPDENDPEIESVQATAVVRAAIQREEDSAAGPVVVPDMDPALVRTRVDVRPMVEVDAEAIEPLTSAASASSPASQASEGANSVPSMVYNPAPQYPAEALRARQTGRVVVHVEILPNGTVSKTQVHQSSGSAALDAAAVAAVRSWRFAAVEDLASRVRRAAIPIRFVID